MPAPYDISIDFYQSQSKRWHTGGPAFLKSWIRTCSSQRLFYQVYDGLPFQTNLKTYDYTLNLYIKTNIQKSTPTYTS